MLQASRRVGNSADKHGEFVLVALIIATIACGFVFYNTANVWIRDTEKPFVVLRIDDVQDFAFRDAQLYLLLHNIGNNIPMSLAIIAKAFGTDSELVETVSNAVQSGSEVMVHGWEHEDLSKLSLEKQQTMLCQAKNHLSEILGINSTILAPPMFSYNNDTLKAMRASGFRILSTSADLHEYGFLSEGILSIPATIELSHFASGIWYMKSVEAIMNEVAKSVETHGYAVIVTHPQEFIKDTAMNQDATTTYNALIQNLRESCSFTTLGDLTDKVMHNTC